MAYTAAMISLGCAKNRVNSEQMMYLLDKAGYNVTGETDGADIVIINTCAFIESAKTEAIETILEMAQLKERGSIRKIIVAGCLPERYKKELLKELPEIDALVGTGCFDDIVKVADSLTKKTEELHPPLQAFGDINAAVSETGRIITTSPYWGYLKIAEGCDNRCAYCAIPSIRGSYRSRPMDAIVEEAKQLTNRGMLELNLIAQDTTAYGKDIYGTKKHNENNLTALLHRLDKIDNLKWIRLLYLYPCDIDDALIDEIAKSDKIVKYLDIPIQHINDKILKKMNRRGSGDDIRRLFDKLREKIDGIVLRTTVITGLPGEGDKEFKELREFLQEAKIERTGIFAYSPEEGTPASKMNRPSGKTASERAEILQYDQSQVMEAFNKSRIGTVCEILIEGENLARSYAEAPEADGYIQITAQENPADTKQPLFSAEITGIRNGMLTAVRVKRDIS